MRSATSNALSDLAKIVTFNPRAPCGARHKEIYAQGTDADLSIHALHAERDEIGINEISDLSRLSIHALHAERDQFVAL